MIIPRRHHRSVYAFAAALLFAASPLRANITVQLDYSFDSKGFFTTHPEAKATLNYAAQILSDRFRDSLTAITPSGGNTWTARPFDPGGGSDLAISNLNVPANTIIVYAGGYQLGGSTLGIGGPGGYDASGFTQDWFDTVAARGQSGALSTPATDYGRWGGSITFNTTTNWNFALGTGPTSSQSDFLSVATHELAHLLGFGTADSFSARISNGVFTGPASGSVNVSPDQAHWASGTKGMVGTALQDADMTPSITTGTRKRFTSIDWAGMSDLGWQLARFGDATDDGNVDFNDLVKLAQNYNITDGQRRWADGDFNFDGNVDFNDLVKLAQNYNTSEAPIPADLLASMPASFAADWQSAQAIAASAPEPSALTFVGFVAFGSLVPRRPRRLRLRTPVQPTSASPATAP
jgi:hypothetical protein